MLLVADIRELYNNGISMSTSAATTREPRPLADLFNAMFRGKRKFSDFVEIDVMANCERKTFTRHGKTREIVSPNDKLKGCHEFIRLFLLDFLPIEPDAVFSYRKGFSAFDAVSRHASSKYFFVTDIASFFPSINRGRIRATLGTARTSSPISDLDIWLDKFVELVCIDDALPVGFSTSPAISNAALLPFDRVIYAECTARGLLYTRYSDDLVVSGNDAEVVAGAAHLVDSLLAETMNGELKLHHGKSKILHRGVKVKLLGMVLLPNGDISVDATVKSEIEVLLHFYLHDKAKFVSFAEGDEQKAEARLSGLLNYVNTVDQAYLDKLRRKFGVAVVDLFIHRSFG